MTHTNLQKNLYYTLNFFDLIGKPLTLFECWQNLFKKKGEVLKSSLLDIQKTLWELPGVEYFNGFYFLKGQKHLVGERSERHNFSQLKWKRAKRVIRLLSLLPFVRMIALCNTVAFDTADRESDIDFLIIVRRGRIWTARMLVTSVVSLLGLRRHNQKIANRICLSFYLADNSLDLNKIALPPCKKGDIPDPYLVYWLTRVCPVYNDGISQRFSFQNKWVYFFMPCYLSYQGVPRRIVKTFWGVQIVKRVSERLLYSQLGNGVEFFCKKTQLSKMARNTKSVARENNTKVIISDEILKFHEQDLRGYYRKTLDPHI